MTMSTSITMAIDIVMVQRFTRVHPTYESHHDDVYVYYYGHVLCADSLLADLGTLGRGRPEYYSSLRQSTGSLNTLGTPECIVR